MDKKLSGLMALFFLAFVIFVSVVLFDKPLSRFTRAKEDVQPSTQNSLMVAWPHTASANGADQVKVDVFIRSETNKPIEGRNVILSSTLGQVQAVSTSADKNGKVSFMLTSAEQGIAELTAIIDNSVPLTQRLTIKFE